MRQLKLFLDMDDVLTNWTGAVKAMGPGPSAGLPVNATQEQKQVMYDAIEAAQESFWSQLEFLPDGRKLWDWLLSKNFQPVLLSSPGKFRWAPAGKIEWIKNNIPGTLFIFEPDKYLYAERNAILIDDMESNIGAWEHEGGIGVLHTSADDTIQKVTEIVKDFFPQTGFKSISSMIRALASA